MKEVEIIINNKQINEIIAKYYNTTPEKVTLFYEDSQAKALISDTMNIRVIDWKASRNRTLHCP